MFDLYQQRSNVSDTQGMGFDIDASTEEKASFETRASSSASYRNEEQVQEKASETYHPTNTEDPKETFGIRKIGNEERFRRGKSVVICKIQKDFRRQGTGLSFVSFSDKPGIYISSIKEESKFINTKLKPGMRVLTVNERPCPRRVRELIEIFRSTEQNLEIAATFAPVKETVVIAQKKTVVLASVRETVDNTKKKTEEDPTTIPAIRQRQQAAAAEEEEQENEQEEQEQEKKKDLKPEQQEEKEEQENLPEATFRASESQRSPEAKKYEQELEQETDDTLGEENQSQQEKKQVHQDVEEEQQQGITEEVPAEDIHLLAKPVICKIRKESPKEGTGLSFTSFTNKEGIYVSSVKEGSKFEGTKIRPGMKILQVNGRACPINIKDLINLFRSIEHDMEITAALTDNVTFREVLPGLASIQSTENGSDDHNIHHGDDVHDNNLDEISFRPVDEFLKMIGCIHPEDQIVDDLIVFEQDYAPVQQRYEEYYDDDEESIELSSDDESLSEKEASAHQRTTNSNLARLSQQDIDAKNWMIESLNTTTSPAAPTAPTAPTTPSTPSTPTLTTESIKDSTIESCQVQVQVFKTMNDRLGITFCSYRQKPGVFVHKLSQTGKFFATDLKVGMKIYEINGVACPTSVSRTLQSIKEITGELIITAIFEHNETEDSATVPTENFKHYKPSIHRGVMESVMRESREPSVSGETRDAQR